MVVDEVQQKLNPILIDTLFNAREPIQGAIIDCDGTLLTSLDAWRSMEGAIARASNGRCIITDAHREQFITMTVAETADYLHETLGFLESPVAVEQFMDDYLMSYYAHDAHPLPGVKQFLAYCAEQNVKMAVASSSKMKYLEAGLKAAGLWDYFTCVCSVDEFGLSKRDPEFFTAVRQKLDTPLETTWVLDDAVYALISATEAGFKTVGLETGEDAPVDVADHSTISIASYVA